MWLLFLGKLLYHKSQLPSWTTKTVLQLSLPLDNEYTCSGSDFLLTNMTPAAWIWVAETNAHFPHVLNSWVQPLSLILIQLNKRVSKHGWDCSSVWEHLLCKWIVPSSIVDVSRQGSERALPENVESQCNTLQWQHLPWDLIQWKVWFSGPDFVQTAQIGSQPLYSVLPPKECWEGGVHIFVGKTD